MASIHEKIIAISREVGNITKNRENKSQGYNFRGIDDIYNEVHPLLAKHGVFSTTKVVGSKSEERASKSGGVIIVRILDVQFDFYAEDGSSVSCTIQGEGADSGDKASNKAQAVAHKYAIMQMFSIPTADAKDPENDSPEVGPVKKTEEIIVKPAAPDVRKIVIDDISTIIKGGHFIDSAKQFYREEIKKATSLADLQRVLAEVKKDNEVAERVSKAGLQGPIKIGIPSKEEVLI